MVLSTVVLALVSGAVSEQQFIDWGWRIPFLLSALLLILGLFVRAKVDETPVFASARPKRSESLPLLEVLRHHPRNLLLAIGIGFGAFVVQATLTTFLLSYAVEAGFTRQTVLNVLAVSSVGAVLASWVSALSDRIGRRPVILGRCHRDGGGVLHPVPPDRHRLGRVADGGRRPRRVSGPPGHVRAVGGAVHGDVRHPDAVHGGLPRLRRLRHGSRFGAGGVASMSGGGVSSLAISALIAASCVITAVSIMATKESHRAELGERPDATDAPGEPAVQS